MTESITRHRMYAMVLYQLSGIQAGIQAWHAENEYKLKHYKKPEYQQWAKIEKTVIILNGGTTNQVGRAAYSAEPYRGTLDIALETILVNGIDAVPFYEPDLNNSMTAIAFLVPEIVWNKELYPEINGRDLGFPITEDREVVNSAIRAKYEELYKDPQAAFLKVFLKSFDLARN